jgi:hypothetical protein
MWLCGVVIVDTGRTPGIGIYVLRGEVPDTNVSLSHSPEGELDWVPCQQLEGLPMVEDLPVLLPRVLAARPGDPPFSALSYYNAQEELILQFS